MLGRDYVYQGWAIESLAGVSAISVLNLTTGFVIALLLAMRAYDISARDHFHLLRLCVRLLPPAPATPGSSRHPKA